MNQNILPPNLPFIKINYPGWGALLEKMTERSLKAEDVRRILGITYRQLNDWEQRGILKSRSEDHTGEKSSAWRRFSIWDLVPLAILVNAKTKGIPLASLQRAMGDVYLSQDAVFEILPGIVMGFEAVFYSNLHDAFAYECPEVNGPIVKLPIFGLENSGVVVVIRLNGIIDEIFQKLERSDFQAFKKPEGGYHFKINGVPLALEELPKNLEVEK